MGMRRTVKWLILVVMSVMLLGVTCGAYGETIVTMTSMAAAPYNEALPKLVEMFEKQNPDIKIKVEYYPFTQLMEITEVKLGSKSSTPDVLFVDGPLVAAYTSRGYLLPLDQYFTQSEQSQWVDASLKAAKAGGKLMTAPLNNSTQVLFYNKRIFRENGIAPLSKDPKDRLTWEEVLELAKKLTIDKNKDGIPEVWGICLNQVNRPYQCLALPNSLGGKGISDDGLKSRGYIDSPEWVKAFTFYQDLFNKYKVAPKGITTEETVNYFTSGRLAMLVAGEFNYKTLQNTPGLEWDYAPHPYFAGGVAATPTGSWHLGINKYTKVPDAAAKWVKFLTTAPGCVEWFKLDGHLPPNKNSLAYIASDPRFSKWPDDIYRLGTYEAQNTAVPRPLTPGYLEWEQVLTQAIEDIRNGADVKSTLSSAAARIDSMLLKYK
ncbi:MAG TPA: sugar ABC transporter substrate-binding protein [Firmicutes bacterium]|nr:sugar ABC transporter substrate-binding protein [Bacillota bacterium]